MWQRIVNFFLMRHLRFKRTAEKLLDRLGAEATEEVFKLLLKGMALFFCIDPKFRKNLKDFNGRYLFATETGPINVAVVYKKNNMYVYEKTLKHFDVRVDFKDYKAIVDFLTHPDPDVLDQMLNQKLKFKGNLNYIIS